MNTLRLSLDHFGAILGDLSSGATFWQKLGFTLAPRSPQMGAVPGVTGMQLWATANHCVPLRRGYLELIGVVAPDRFNPWRAQLNRYQGFHIVALRCDDADVAFRALCKRVEGLEPPVDRRRKAPWGTSTRTMRFRNIYSHDSAWPDCKLIVIEHQTPEIIWQPGGMAHPNGAVALEAVLFRTREPEALRDQFAALADVAPVRISDGETRIPLSGGGAFAVMTDSGFAELFPGTSPPQDAAFVGAEVSVDDLSITASVLAANRVSYNEADDTLWVPPPATGGGVIRFVKA